MPNAIVVREVGGPERLRVEERDPGAPESGEARVRVVAAGVNFIDVYHRTGLYGRPLPFVLGQEGSGVVEAVGDGVDSLRVGDRVAWATVPGSYADVVVGPADKMVRIPTRVSDDAAAASMLQGMTAHYLTHGVRETRPGDSALVHAAAGGVGLLLTQMLKAAGARVIATCSTQEKAVLAREAGADVVVLYASRASDSEGFVVEARRATGGRGVDVVYDSVGKSTFEGSVRALCVRGLVVSFGQSSGVVPPLELRKLSEFGSLFLTRPALGHYLRDRSELEMRANAVLTAVAEGRLRVRIGARFSLSQAADAHRALEGRETTGKVLLVPERAG